MFRRKHIAVRNTINRYIFEHLELRVLPNHRIEISGNFYRNDREGGLIHLLCASQASTKLGLQWKSHPGGTKINNVIIQYYRYTLQSKFRFLELA